MSTIYRLVLAALSVLLFVLPATAQEGNGLFTDPDTPADDSADTPETINISPTAVPAASSTAAIPRTPVGDYSERIAAMSLEQKIAQMLLVTLHGAYMNEPSREFLQTWQPGGVVLFTSNAADPFTMTQLTNNFQQTMVDLGAPPLFISVDQEGGKVARLTDGFTTLPGPNIITAAGDEMAFRMGRLVGTELKAVGINMNLAPVADLETNRDNPIMFRRTFGNDPAVTGRAVAQYIAGLQSVGVLATAKHFPGHGDTNEDSHGELPILMHSRERLDTVEIVPFQHAIDADVSAVMVAHIWYPQIESQPNMPSSLSPAVVTGLLREDLGFGGLAVTDAMDMNAVDLTYNYAEAAVMAVDAGIDVLALGPGYGLDLAEETILYIADAVRSGRIPEARIDEAVNRIFAYKDHYGILDWGPLDPEGAVERVNFEGHAEVMDELFRLGTTIAYDRNNLLPLTDDRNVAIIFLATRYQIQHECSEYNPNIRWVGVSDEPSPEEVSWAREAALASDVAVVWTQDAVFNERQQVLVQSMPADRTVAVALFSPYDWQTYPNVAAFVATYSPARPAVPAACAVLFGAIPANGQLAVSLSPELPAGSRAQ